MGESPGFASTYGGDEDTAEDIAEITGWALISKLLAGIAGDQIYTDENRACRAMQKQPGPGIPAKLAAVFAKVGFVHSLGFITDEAYDDCVGNLKIRGDGSGFFTIEAGQQIVKYSRNASLPSARRNKEPIHEKSEQKPGTKAKADPSLTSGQRNRPSCPFFLLHFVSPARLLRVGTQ